MKKSMYNEKRFHDFREIINYSAKKFRNRSAFKIKNGDGSYIDISYSNLRERFYALSSNLLNMGLKGKKIAVIGKNCFEWILSYLCAATVGVVVPIDKELHPEDMKDFMDSAECEAVCAESKILTDLKPIVKENVICMDFNEVSQRSLSFNSEESEINNIALPKDEMQILIFTSGTTGNSKGVCLSQYNICSNIHSTVSVVKIKPDDKTLSILPLHHTYECTLNCLLLLSRGACITYNDGLSKIQKNLTEYSPSVLVVVPAILSLLNKRISKAVAKDCPDKYKELFETKPLAEALPKVPFIIRKVICAKVKKSLGGRIRLFIVGAAELDPSIVRDFNALGIKTLQGYGLTECSPLLAGNSDFYLNAASTGIAIPGVTLKLDSPNEDGIGEILAKGDNIMLGYYRDQEATAKVFKDGWFCTGDLGSMDADGALYIKGRRKNVIVTANGKNIYPEELETRLAKYLEISEVIVVADKKNGDTCVKAKIFPNLDYLKEKLGRLPSIDDIRDAVQKAISDVNEKIPTYKHIKAVEILTNALEKTTTQKIKRCGTNLV